MENLWAFIQFIIAAGVIWLAFIAFQKKSGPQASLLSGNKPQKAKRTRAVDLSGDGESPLGAAGVHQYADTLRALFHKSIADYGESVDSQGDVDFVDVIVELAPVADNVHDANAVEVRVRGQLVGFVPARLASAFRTRVHQMGLRGPVYQCKAEVSIPIPPASDDEWAISLDLPRLETKVMK